MAKAKRIEGLECEGDVRAGARLVLSTRLDEMCSVRESALDFTDIKGVHDMRVASRRLRSALRDFAPYMRRGIIPSKGLKALADALGRVRDEDVAIKALGKLKATVTSGIADGIERIIDERRCRRERAREALKARLTENALAELHEKYIARFEQATIANMEQDAPRASRTARPLSFRRAGREIILARFDELKALSYSLNHPFDAERLHRMRIAAKRLRYAVELFHACWVGEPFTQVAKEIAELQKSLGELHDCDVWIADLGARLDERRAENGSAIQVWARERKRERRAAIWLLRHFVKGRTRHFQDALARWNRWETSGFYRSLVKPDSRTK